MPRPKQLRESNKIGDDRPNIGDDHIFRDNNLIYPGLFKFQLIVIAAYVSLEIFVSRLIRSEDGFFSYFCFYLLDVLFFYSNLIVSLPLIYSKPKKILKSIVITSALLVVHFSIRVFIFAGLYFEYNWLSALTSKPFYVSAFWRTIWIFGLSALYWDRLYIVKKLKRESILENALLHARISPHLIFNSLNFAYADNDPYSSGGKMIVLLGEFARYSMSELPSDGKAHLANEIKQLKCLISMCELRFPKMLLTVDIDNEVVNSHVQVPPQLIVSLAENLFKYADLYSSTHPAIIAIWKDNKCVYIHMENGKIEQEGIVSHKIGLQNVKQRLKKIYSHKYRLDIDNQPDSFKLDLSIPI